MKKKVSSIPCLLGRYLMLTFGLVFAACSENRPEETELLVLYTSDVMNYTLPYDFLKDCPSDVCLANFSTIVKEQRREYGENCLVLDNGNKLLGTVPAGYYNYVDVASEHLAFRTERMIGYDAVGIGDKDLDVSILLDKTRWNPDNQPPVICANLVDAASGVPLFQPYKIFERQGIRIAVLGLVSPNLLPWFPQENRKEVELQDMIECAARWMPVIQQEKPDLVIGLCGASFRYQDHGEAIDTYKNPNGSVPTAIRVPGFDLMLMGGTSEREVFEVRNDAGQSVTCIQTGSNSTHCGKIRVELTKDADGTYKKRIYADIVDLKQYEPDAEYCKQLEGVKDTLNTWLKNPLGELGDTLYGIDGFFKADLYRQIIHRAQLWFTGADVSLASCLIGSDTILPGTITPRSLFQIYPYANSLEVMEMTGQDILQTLEYTSGLQFETMSSPSDHLLALKRDVKGQIVKNIRGEISLATHPRSFTSAAGVRYTVDVSKPVGRRVQILSMADGTPFDLRKVYKVAINSFQGKDGGQFFSDGLGWDRATIDLHAIPRPQFSVRYAIQEYVLAMSGEPIRDNHSESWRLIPESLVAPAIERERKEPLPAW